MKSKITISLITLLLMTSSCKKEKVGGECEYVSLIKNVAVTFIDGNINDGFTASFQPVGIETDEVYRITEKEFKKIKRNFDLIQLSNKENSYSLKISEITKGSCTPFMIDEIELID